MERCTGREAYLTRYAPAFNKAAAAAGVNGIEVVAALLDGVAHGMHLGVDIITLTALQDSTDARFVPRIQGIRGLVRIQIDIMEAIA